MPEWRTLSGHGTIVATTLFIRVEGLIMDVGITTSNKQHPVHFITGLVVVTLGYSMVMFAVRAFVMR